MISYRLLIGIGIAALLGVFLLVRAMQRVSLRVQFMVLLGLGVTIGFIFLVMVQMRSFPEWFGVSLMLVVFVASLFGTRIFLRSCHWKTRRPRTKLAKNIAAVLRVQRLADPRSARHIP